MRPTEKRSSLSGTLGRMFGKSKGKAGSELHCTITGTASSPTTRWRLVGAVFCVLGACGSGWGCHCMTGTYRPACCCLLAGCAMRYGTASLGGCQEMPRDAKRCQEMPRKKELIKRNLIVGESNHRPDDIGFEPPYAEFAACFAPITLGAEILYAQDKKCPTMH